MPGKWAKTVDIAQSGWPFLPIAYFFDLGEDSSSELDSCLCWHWPWYRRMSFVLCWFFPKTAMLSLSSFLKLPTPAKSETPRVLVPVFGLWFLQCLWVCVWGGGLWMEGVPEANVEFLPPPLSTLWQGSLLNLGLSVLTRLTDQQAPGFTCPPSTLASWLQMHTPAPGF